MHFDILNFKKFIAHSSYFDKHIYFSTLSPMSQSSATSANRTCQYKASLDHISNLSIHFQPSFLLSLVWKHLNHFHTFHYIMRLDQASMAHISQHMTPQRCTDFYFDNLGIFQTIKAEYKDCLELINHHWSYIPQNMWCHYSMNIRLLRAAQCTACGTDCSMNMDWLWY